MLWNLKTITIRAQIGWNPLENYYVSARARLFVVVSKKHNNNNNERHAVSSTKEKNQTWKIKIKIYIFQSNEKRETQKTT